MLYCTVNTVVLVKFVVFGSFYDLQSALRCLNESFKFQVESESNMLYY
jgi:hypothetical protein